MFLHIHVLGDWSNLEIIHLNWNSYFCKMSAIWFRPQRVNPKMALAAQMLTHWGRDKIEAILQTTFSNAISWIKMFEFWL